MALKTLWISSTFADRSIIAILIVTTILSFQHQSKSRVGSYVVIESPTGIYSRNPLSVDTTLTPAGILGETTIQIENGAVRVVASACPLKICVSRGSIDHTDDLIACVPNGILIYVETDSGEESSGSKKVEENRIEEKIGRGYDQISR